MCIQIDIAHQTSNVFVFLCKVTCNLPQLARYKKNGLDFLLGSTLDVQIQSLQGIKGGVTAHEELITMTRTRPDIHFDNGALQTVFDANRMSVFGLF